MDFPNSPVENQVVRDEDGMFFIYRSGRWVKRRENVKATVTGGAVNLAQGDVQVMTGVSGTVTLAFQNPLAAPLVNEFYLDVTSTGAHTLTWPASVDWSKGTPPTPTAGGRDIYAFMSYDGGTTWIGTVVGSDYK